jgi:cytochrome c peroxidase
MNMSARTAIFFDGRAKDLADQVHFPIADKNEMNFSIEKVAKRLKKDKRYKLWFKEIYNEEPTSTNIADAIAAFEMSLETSESDFDYFMADMPNNMSESAQRGRLLFNSERAKCFDCHFSPDFTGDEFKNIGLYDERQFMDKGRYDATKDPQDLGKFKVPGLRNVEITAPYMHNGMFSTLEEVVDYYDNPYKFVAKPINMDSLLIRPLNFTLQEKEDLVAFLKSLTDYRFKKHN